VVRSGKLRGERRPPRAFRERTVDELTIDDERSFARVAVYADLKEVLLRAGYVFRVLPKKYAGRWDRALLLNLTYWGDGGGDVLDGDHVPADVVAHAAWHHLAAVALAGTARGAPSVEALVLGESIASAFDLYLVGALLGRATRSSFLETQVAAMAEAARTAGRSAREFEAMLEGVAGDPEGAFADLRRLLYDATLALAACRGADEGLVALARFDRQTLGALLHHYELSNWALYIRAYARRRRSPDPRARAVDASLRTRRDPLAWLVARWVAPALA
jgi:hypothetical protein